jgi:hypothetical protein
MIETCVPAGSWAWRGGTAPILVLVLEFGVGFGFGFPLDVVAFVYRALVRVGPRRPRPRSPGARLWDWNWV